MIDNKSGQLVWSSFVEYIIKANVDESERSKESITNF